MKVLSRQKICTEVYGKIFGANVLSREYFLVVELIVSKWIYMSSPSSWRQLWYVLEDMLKVGKASFVSELNYCILFWTLTVRQQWYPLQAVLNNFRFAVVFSEQLYTVLCTAGSISVWNWIETEPFAPNFLSKHLGRTLCLKKTTVW